MNKEEFKKEVLTEVAKELSLFVDSAGHIGRITEVEKLGRIINFKYENPLQGNAINGGCIKIEMYY